MATLSFEGETQQELVQQVRRWLASVEGGEGGPTLVDVVNQSAELTKDALHVIAGRAPGPVGQSDLFHALETMGYRTTDATRDAALTGLEALEKATGGSIVRRVVGSSRQAVYEMNIQVAKEILRTLTARSGS